ncbi:hypothetical protein ACOKW7_08880 [Limnospira platensis CENA597]|uniref:hypothetical protein n=1 Tax=Limnospira platensis TaxID=118562 RepID=UPI003DA062A4
MKIKQAIDLHKFLTFLVVLGLMVAYNNFTIGPWVYLALHGTYGILWLLKSRIYPDKQWEEEVTWWKGVAVFTFLLLYWVAPFLLVSSYSEPAPILISAAISINLWGVF